VNNAGIYEFSPIENVTPEHFHKMYDINVLGLLSTSREATKYFGKDGGSIINISSLVSVMGLPAASAYSGTKGAVDSITRVLAKELGPRKIRVNSINPGMVVTEGVKSAGFEGGDLQKDIESRTPLGRIGRPEDIAPAAVFFASQDSAWITGETLVIAGGLR
jgi:3-oxoacyl-[acyl-carrier protein] reductase